MQIKIIEEDFNLILGDENLDNDNFVELSLLDNEGNSIINSNEIITLSVTELLVALQAFDTQRRMRLERERLMA